MKYSSLYCVSFSVFVFAALLNLILVGIRPPKVVSYAQVLPNGKIVVDKDLLESPSQQYPPVISACLWLIGNGALAEWLMPLTLESVVPAARSRSGLGNHAAFWLDKEAGEKLLGPVNDVSSYEGTYWLSHLKLVLKATNEEASQYLSAFGGDDMEAPDYYWTTSNNDNPCPIDSCLPSRYSVSENE